MKKSKKVLNVIMIIVGSLSLAIGSIGIVLPLLPTTPFFLLTLFCYTKSSERFEKWFISTKLYKKYLENFVKTKAMTKANKVKVLVLVTILFSIPLIIVNNIFLRIALGIILGCHYFFLILKVKSVSKAELQNLVAEYDLKHKEL